MPLRVRKPLERRLSVSFVVAVAICLYWADVALFTRCKFCQEIRIICCLDLKCLEMFNQGNKVLIYCARLCSVLWLCIVTVAIKLCITFPPTCSVKRKKSANIKKLLSLDLANDLAYYSYVQLICTTIWLNALVYQIRKYKHNWQHEERKPTCSICEFVIWHIWSFRNPTQLLSISCRQRIGMYMLSYFVLLMSQLAFSIGA